MDGAGAGPGREGEGEGEGQEEERMGRWDLIMEEEEGFFSFLSFYYLEIYIRDL